MTIKHKLIIPNLNHWLQVGLSVFGIGISLFLLIVIFFHLVFLYRIYPGIMVAHINLGGKSLDKAKLALEQNINNKEKLLILGYQSQQWKINLSDFDFKYLPAETINKAYLTGRSGSWKKDLQAIIKSVNKKINLNMDYEINQSLLNAAIASISGQINIPSISPSIQIYKNEQGHSQIIVENGQSGLELQETEVRETIGQKVGWLEEFYFNLPVKEISPSISQQQAEAVKNRAENFLNKKITLKFDENSWQLSEAELINFLAFDNDFDKEKISAFTNQLADSVNRPSQNALFNFQNGRVIEFKPAKKGRLLDKEKTESLLWQNLAKLEKNGQKEIITNLSIIYTEPEIANENVNNLGIKELIGQGESWFAGSISSRIHNIKLASSQINGLLIPPGQTFSLNEALGDVSAQTGYKQAWIIKDGRTILGDGGGVCQVSTTLFRAILNAGLPIEERKAHAYRVSYYEQNYQPGIDATVFSPSPDLKFKNDTPGHILIQTNINTSQMKAVYNLYGTPDGRIATISKTRIWDQAPPPPDLYQDDPTLPAGIVKQIDWAAWGAKTAFDWKVTRNQEVLQEQTFYSYYKPWQAVFLRGTGGQ